MKQVIAQEPVQLNHQLSLDEEQAHHLFDVLRTGSRETVRVLWNNEVYLAHPEQKPFLYVFGKEEVEPRLVDITLATALIKQERFEWMLQKAAELGVSRIVPFESRNCVVQIRTPEKEEKKLKRWNSILDSAVKQSNRPDTVLLEPIQSLSTLSNYKSEKNLVAYEGEEKDHLASKLHQNPKSVTIVIGPEGGFDPDEIEQLKNMGFETCSLGKQILRAETAALYALSALEYQSHLPEVKEE